MVLKNNLEKLSKTLKNMFWGHLYSNTSIVNFWNKPRDDHTHKPSWRPNKLIVTFCKTHPPQKCHVNVLHDTVMLHKSSRVQSRSDAKNLIFVVRYHISWQRIMQVEWISGSVLVTMSWMWHWRFSFIAVALNFFKWIQN